MASTALSHTFVQVTSPEEGNWLSLGRALTTVLCHGVRPYIKREVAIFYNNVTAAMAALPAVHCTCVFDPRRKKNQYHEMSTCAWAQLLQSFHLGNKPNWKQSDASKWTDPNIGPWEITKLFLPDIGGHTVIESVEDMDITALLNLMFWCNHFIVQRALIKDVRETRNTKWVHVPKLKLSDAEKRAAFETIEKLLQDPVFVGDPDAQGALQDVLALKCTSDVHIFKAEVLSQFKEAIRSDVSSLKNELHNFQKALERMEKKSATSTSSLTFILVLSMAAITFLDKSGRRMRRKSLAAWLMVWLLCFLFGISDHGSYRGGYETIGCYRDTENRAIQSLEGKDSVLDGQYESRKSPIAKCAVAATRAGYSMFAVQNGGWCAASAAAPQTFDKFGKSTACKNDGEGGPWANQVYVIKGYETTGCYKDTANRAIQTLEGTDSVLDGRYQSRENPIGKCAAAAMRAGHSMFAVQNGGWCAASATAPKTFDKYGKSKACKDDGEGGPWANQVYVIKVVSHGNKIGCYKDTANRAIQTLEGKYESRENPIAKCAEAGTRAEYSMFPVQSGGWCVASATAPQTFDKYGKSSACKDDGEDRPWANQVYVINGYKSIGCFRDTANRAIQSLEGTDSVLDGQYEFRENPIAKCAVAAMRASFSIFAVQNGGWCAASKTAPQTFDKYGKSTACKDDGEGGPWANQVYVIRGHESIGCYRDTANRAIQSLEGKDSVLDGRYESRKNPIAKCAVAAMRAGYGMFAVQNGGWCAASKTAPQTFDKYGKSAACKEDGEGGPWANQVYVIKGCPTEDISVPFDTKEFHLTDYITIARKTCIGGCTKR